MQKLRNLEFLRSYLIITIILLHMSINRSWSLLGLYPDVDIYNSIQKAFAHANNSVEGFFIIAGFLLVLTFKNGTTFADFVKKKYIRLAPVICFSILLVIVGDIFNILSFKPIPDILSILLLNNFGICFAVSDNPILWYTSALFGGMVLYFGIQKCIREKRHLLIFSILCFVGYLILEILQGGKFSHPFVNHYGILNTGFLRAVGGMGLGCVSGVLYKNNSEKILKAEFNNSLKIFISAAEFASLSFLIWWTLFPHPHINNIFFVLNFVVLLSLFIVKKGYFSTLFDSEIWVKLGRYQYSLYVIHYLVLQIFGVALWKTNSAFVCSHPYLPIVVMFLAVLVLGVFVYHFIEIPSVNFLRNKFLTKQKLPE